VYLCVYLVVTVNTRYFLKSWFVYVMDPDFLLCEEGTHCLYIIYVKISIQRLRAQ